MVDDLPDVVPVTAPELDAVETYLGGLIDQLLADAKAAECTAQADRPSNQRNAVAASRPRS